MSVRCGDFNLSDIDNFKIQACILINSGREAEDHYGAFVLNFDFYLVNNQSA
jgi:hypothetical protein